MDGDLDARPWATFQKSGSDWRFALDLQNRRKWKVFHGQRGQLRVGSDTVNDKKITSASSASLSTPLASGRTDFY